MKHITDYNNWEEFKYYLELITNTFLDIEDELDWEKIDDMSIDLDKGTYYYIEDKFNSKSSSIKVFIFGEGTNIHKHELGYLLKLCSALENKNLSVSFKSLEDWETEFSFEIHVRFYYY